MRADHLAIVHQLQIADLVQADREVIGPELHHPLAELRLRERRAIPRRVGQLIIDLVAVLRRQHRERHLRHRQSRGHDGLDRAVIDGRRAQLVVEVARVPEAARQRDFLRGQSHRDATNEAEHRIAPRRRGVGRSVCRLSDRERAGAAALRALGFERLRRSQSDRGRCADREEATAAGAVVAGGRVLAHGFRMLSVGSRHVGRRRGRVVGY